MLPMLLCLWLPPATQSPAAADPLGAAQEATAAVRQASLRYALTSTLENASCEIRVDYVAPDRVRIDRTAGGATSSMWLVDGVFAVSSAEGPKPARGRSDSAAVVAELAPAEQALLQAFPNARRRGTKRAAIGMNWGFDEESQKVTVALESQLRAADESPFGWITTLRRKAVPAVDEGAVWSFSTDGHCRVTLSKATGFVQSLDAESPKGKLHMELLELSTEAEVDPARFHLPVAAEGPGDASESLTRVVRRMEEMDLRGRIYGAIAGDGAAAWDEALRARIDQVLRAFHGRTIQKAFEPWMERSRTIHTTISERLAKLRAAGNPPEEVEALRQRERGYLLKQLDEFEKTLATRLSEPELDSPLPRAAELFLREQGVLAEVFRAQVREPALEAYDRATGSNPRPGGG